MRPAVICLSAMMLNQKLRQAWERVAAEAMRLEVIPPAFEQLRRKKRRRKPVPYELIPPSLARMLWRTGGIATVADALRVAGGTTARRLPGQTKASRMSAMKP
jgi:hypothetical protein